MKTLLGAVVVAMYFSMVCFSALIDSNALTLLIGLLVGIWYVFCTYSKFSNKVLAKI